MADEKMVLMDLGDGVREMADVSEDVQFKVKFQGTLTAAEEGEVVSDEFDFSFTSGDDSITFRFDHDGQEVISLGLLELIDLLSPATADTLQSADSSPSTSEGMESTNGVVKEEEKEEVPLWAYPEPSQTLEEFQSTLRARGVGYGEWLQKYSSTIRGQQPELRIWNSF